MPAVPAADGRIRILSWRSADAPRPQRVPGIRFCGISNDLLPAHALRTGTVRAPLQRWSDAPAADLRRLIRFETWRARAHNGSMSKSFLSANRWMGLVVLCGCT